MPKTQTATKNGNKASAPEVEAQINEEESQAEEKSRGAGRSTNPYMLRLTPEMLTSPHPLEIREGRIVNSLDFALAKLDVMIAAPLGLNTEEEWLSFARMLFAYRQRMEEQRVEEQARKLGDELKDSPAMLQRLVQLLNAQLAAHFNGQPPVQPTVYAGEYGQPVPFDVSRYS